MLDSRTRLVHSSLRSALLASAAAFALTATAGAAPIQDGTTIDVSGTVSAGGGGVSQGGEFSVIGSIGQMGVDTMQGGEFDFSSGLLLPTVTTCEFADIDCNGSVDGADLGLLLVNWGPCPNGEPCIGDVNRDGMVDAVDLATLISSWG